MESANERTDPSAKPKFTVPECSLPASVDRRCSSRCACRNGAGTGAKQCRGEQRGVPPSPPVSADSRAGSRIVGTCRRHRGDALHLADMIVLDVPSTIDWKPVLMSHWPKHPAFDAVLLKPIGKGPHVGGRRHGRGGNYPPATAFRHTSYRHRYQTTAADTSAVVIAAGGCTAELMLRCPPPARTVAGGSGNRRA